MSGSTVPSNPDLTRKANPQIPQLKDSHVSLTHEVLPEYSTSYNSLFYKKDADPQGLAPKLQTSSLPLGTFSRYIAGDRR